MRRHLTRCMPFQAPRMIHTPFQEPRPRLSHTPTPACTPTPRRAAARAAKRSTLLLRRRGPRAIRKAQSLDAPMYLTQNIHAKIFRGN
jgi:hypothetical protein